MILTRSLVQRVCLSQVGRDTGDTGILTHLVVSLLEDDDLRFSSQSQGNHVLLVLQTQPVVVRASVVGTVLVDNLLGDVQRRAVFAKSIHYGEVNLPFVSSSSTTFHVKEVVSAEEDFLTRTFSQLIANEHIAVLQRLQIVYCCSISCASKAHQSECKSK